MDNQTQTKATRKGIPYKTPETRATTHILVRLTESQKQKIQNNATKHNLTVSEYFRTLAIKNLDKIGRGK